MSNQKFPELNLLVGYHLECLYGRHRIQAGKETLLRQDQLWTVNFYLMSKLFSKHICCKNRLTSVQILTESSKRVSLRNILTRQNHPTVKLIVRQVNIISKKASVSKKRWWNRLSPHGAKNLKQLLRYDKFTTAFDALLEILRL